MVQNILNVSYHIRNNYKLFDMINSNTPNNVLNLPNDIIQEIGKWCDTVLPMKNENSIKSICLKIF